MDPTKFDYPEFHLGFEFDDERPLFVLTVQEGTSTREVTPDQFPDVEQSRDEEAQVFVFHSRNTGTVRVEFRRAGPEVTGSIEVEPADGITVREVRFPHITWQSVEAFDSLLMSTAWGDNIERPTKTIRERCGGEISYIYPSELAMQYMVLHNPGRAVYLSRYGVGDESFRLSAASLSDRSLALYVVHYPFVSSGKWKSPDCGFAILPGGWHAAADLYGLHMRGEFAPPDVPQWMREEFHGWVQVGMSFVDGGVKHRFSDLPAVFRRIQETGLNTMHVFGWCGRGHDTEYPDYNINPALGTQDDLRAAMDEIRSMGGHAILYTNGRLVDPESAFYTGGGSKSLCVREDGTPYTENYGTGVEFRIACPTREDYHAKMASEVECIARVLHAHAIQIDQISCNTGFLCFDPSHPHPTPSTNFLPGVSAMLQRIRETHRAIDPDFFTWCEGCHERFGQFYDVNQGHGEEFTWQIGESTPEQFSYNYPDYIVTGICDTVQKLCYTYAQGKPFDFHLKALDDPDLATLVKELVAVRKTHADYFLHGTFRDRVGLGCSAGVRVFRIDHPVSAAALINVWTPGLAAGRGASASIRLRGMRGDVTLIYPNDLAAEANGDWLEMSWTGPVASVVVTF